MVSGSLKIVMSGKPYERLEAWKLAMDLVTEIYHITGQFPGDEKFVLISQMRRAALSIPSNIAEGAGRDSPKEFANFLSIARGSLSELETQYVVAKRLNYNTESQTIINTMDRTGRLLTGIHKKLRNTTDH